MIIIAAAPMIPIVMTMPKKEARRRAASQPCGNAGAVVSWLELEMETVMSTSTNNTPKSQAGHVGRSVYDGKRPLKPAQLARAKKTIAAGNALGAWLIANEGALPDGFELDV